MKIKILFAVLIIFGLAVGFSLSRHKDDGTDRSMETEKPVRTSSNADTAKPDSKPASPSEAKSVIRWYPYDEGMALGKDKKKKVFLNFYADWCGYCKKMDNSTFADKSVISYLNENFIPVKVNADKDTRLAEVYKVHGLPVSFFIPDDGDPMSIPGYVPPNMMMSLLRYIHTDSYKKMSFDKFEK